MRRMLIGLMTCFFFIAPVASQTIYKCSQKSGGVAFQETPCENDSQTQDVRSFKREPDAPNDYGQYRQWDNVRRSEVEQEVSAPQVGGGMPQVVKSSSGSTGYVRCIRPEGGSYLHRGDSCPVRSEPVEHKAGMVTDVTTGRQQYMVPGGGNGMIDPQTGKRHELISPPPRRKVQDAAVPVSQDQACAEAKAARDRALSNFKRTMTSMRAAEARYERMCDS